jgi:hypothetical protein
MGLCLLVAGTLASAQTPAPAQAAPTPEAPPRAEHDPAPPMEAKAIDILKAMGQRLAAARSLSFTAVATFERSSRFGHVLQYSSKYEVTLQRPDKLRIVTVGDGPRSEFYYDGKTMSQLAPVENLVAVAEAPPTIDGMLVHAFESADIYFPFTDFLVADPYADLAAGMELAFYVGPSVVVDGTTTDMVAFESNGVFVQAWVGAEDKLPRRARAQFDSDPWQLRHQVDVSDWKLDPVVAADAFASAKVASAKRIEFHRREADMPPGAQPLSETLKAKESKPKPQ